MQTVKSKLKKWIKLLEKDKWCLRRQVKVKTQHFGGGGYGGWRVAFEYIPSNPIVYSFGVGEDISFDLDLIQKYNAKVYAFDPTPKSIEWVKRQTLPENFYFHEYGISDKNEIEKFYLPKNDDYVSGSTTASDRLKDKPIEVDMRKFSTIVKQLKHDNIDLLKMDIEGSEFKVVPDILKENISIRQICIEFHGRFMEDGVKKQNELIQMLNEKGYYIIYVSDSFQELTFLKNFQLGK